MGFSGGFRMSSMTYFEHYDIAKSRWMEHITNCAAELEIEFDSEERRYASESFDECEQLKWVNNNQSIKVKWEHCCWWADCKTPHAFHGRYYSILCVMPLFQLPHEVAKGRF